jgi:DNA repair exonuclease SbcCD ATPase subunit
MGILKDSLDALDEGYPGIAADYLALQQRVRELEAERDELKRWKAEQLAVESTWDAQVVGKLIGCKWGEGIREKIEPFIKDTIAERDRLKAELAECKSERTKRIKQLEIGYDELRKICNKQQKENKTLRARLERLVEEAGKFLEIWKHYDSNTVAGLDELKSALNALKGGTNVRS